MPTIWCARHQLRQHVQRHAIVRIVERRHQHDAVGDVEVGVAGGQPLAVHRSRGRGIRQRTICSGPTSGSSGAAPAGGGCPSIARGSRRPGPASTASTTVSGGDEPRDVVDVAVRVVAGAAFAEPDRPARAEPLAERLARSPRASVPGLRTCTSLSSHSSVTSSSPAPLTSMPPPSSTIAPAGVGARRLDVRQPRDVGDGAADLRRRRASWRTSPTR